MSGYAVGKSWPVCLCTCVSWGVDDVWLSGDPDLFII